jgi:hypothetical protein
MTVAVLITKVPHGMPVAHIQITFVELQIVRPPQILGDDCSASATPSPSRSGKATICPVIASREGTESASTGGPN